MVSIKKFLQIGKLDDIAVISLPVSTCLFTLVASMPTLSHVAAKPMSFYAKKNIPVLKPFSEFSPSTSEN